MSSVETRTCTSMSSAPTRTCVPLQAKSKDADLSQTINRALAASGHRLLCTIEVGAHEGLVTLKGNVPTYYLKQMAQTIAMQHQAVEMLQNDIQVISTDSRSLQDDLSAKGTP